jgi:hypothetical protein
MPVHPAIRPLQSTIGSEYVMEWKISPVFSNECPEKTAGAFGLSQPCKNDRMKAITKQEHTAV